VEGQGDKSDYCGLREYRMPFSGHAFCGGRVIYIYIYFIDGCPVSWPTLLLAMQEHTLSTMSQAESFAVVEETAVAKGIRTVSGVTQEAAVQATLISLIVH
jgi:hypothetical protein